MNRRLEDRIRTLCAEALRIQNDREFRKSLRDLRAALDESNRRLKRVALLKLVGKDDGLQERRVA